ncbi:hypothetical protein EDD21DRAFT_359282 [Dissophora ornata]|nr:hypothetical protein EDD21DRAFT_359282 [Dissophora ornata]
MSQEQHMTLQAGSLIPQPAVFKTESPKVATWDVLQEPVPADMLDRIPVEVWTMILNHVPPARLARLTVVSKGWRILIQELPLWKDISIACEFGDPLQNVKGYKELVLGHMAIICNVCLQKKLQLRGGCPAACSSSRSSGSGLDVQTMPR